MRFQFTFQLKLHNPNIKQWFARGVRDIGGGSGAGAWSDAGPADGEADSLRWMRLLCCDFGLAQKSTSCIFHQSYVAGVGGLWQSVVVGKCILCVTCPLTLMPSHLISQVSVTGSFQYFMSIGRHNQAKAATFEF